MLLGDEALAALANKGLVRRARKDLETNPPKLTETGGDKVTIQVEDCTVELAEIPSQSKCTCPASGVCRHILSALLFLRESQSPAALAAPALFDSAELLSITDETLAKWAGKPLMQRAKLALHIGLPAEFDEQGSLVIRLPTWNTVCHWMPGGGLEGMLCSCHTPGPCVHRVAAILTYLLARGQRAAEPPPALEAAAETPRTRSEVLDSVGRLLCETVSLGLSRLSPATVDRLRTLAISAHGVDLPRMQRLLDSLAHDAVQHLERHAQASSAGLLGKAAQIEALRCALKQPTAALVGQHRSHYEKVGDVKLIGMGARKFRTASGYIGLTVYFWDQLIKNWTTWTSVRPIAVPGFDPAKQYTQDGPWIGCQSPHQACRSVVRLTGTWRNHAGRLSARSSTRALVLGPSNPSAVPGFDQWSEIAPRAQRLFGGGLGGPLQQDEVVFLHPQVWAPPQFDQVRQELVRFLIDKTGRALPLVLPHTSFTEEAIGVLEQYQPTAPRPVLGLLRLDADRLSVEPIAFYVDNDIFNFTLDVNVDPKKTAQPAPAAEEEEEDEETEEIPIAPSSSPLGQLLARSAEQLESVAEGGLRSVRNIDTLRNLVHQADGVGLASLSRPIARLADQLDQIRKSVETDPTIAAGTLLRAYYVVSFAAAQEAVTGATAAIGS
jgi:SWIM zinc finger